MSSRKLYEQFLVTWIDRHPDDLRTLRELVSFYWKDKNNPQVDKALHHLENFVKAKPEDFEMQVRLMQSYIFMGEEKKALTMIMALLPHSQTEDKMILYFYLGELHYEMGNKKEAVKSLEASLEILRKIKTPSLDDIDRKFLSEKSIQELDGIVPPKKEDMIQETMDRINYMREH